MRWGQVFDGRRGAAASHAADGSGGGAAVAAVAALASSALAWKIHRQDSTDGADTHGQDGEVIEWHVAFCHI